MLLGDAAYLQLHQALHGKADPLVGHRGSLGSGVAFAPRIQPVIVDDHPSRTARWDTIVLCAS